MISVQYKSLAVFVALILAVSAVAAAADGKKKTKPSVLQATGGPKTGKPVQTFTNADLERMFGGGSDDEAPAATDAKTPGSSQPSVRQVAADGRTALEKMQEQQRAAVARREQIAQAEERLAAAKTQLATGEKRVRALRNPYLPKPTASADGKDDWKDVSTAERLERSGSELEQARKAVADAQAELDRLRRSAP